MPKRLSKPRDLNRLAASIVDDATAEALSAEPAAEREKNPAAVELGRRGGLRGGKARAEKMTAEEQSGAARRAARARWAKPNR